MAGSRCSDQRALPAASRPTCRTTPRAAVAEGIRDHGRARRARDRVRRRLRRRARSAAAAGRGRRGLRGRPGARARGAGGRAAPPRSTCSGRSRACARSEKALDGAAPPAAAAALLEEAHAIARRGRAVEPRDGRARRGAARGRRASTDALQRRRARDRRPRHRARRHPLGGRSGQEHRGARRRDAAVPAGSAPDRVGAGAGRHPA